MKISQQPVKERLQLHNLSTDPVTIRSELIYLNLAQIVNVKCQVLGGKTGPFPTVWVFFMAGPVGMVKFKVEPTLELNWE